MWDLSLGTCRATHRRLNEHADDRHHRFGHRGPAGVVPVRVLTSRELDVSSDQFPGQIGRRLSLNAATPSRRSAENAVARQAPSSTSRPADRLVSAPSRSARFALRTPTGEFAAICSASSSAAVRAVPAGTRRSTSPKRSASSTASRRPVKMRSAAREAPTLRTTSCVPPPPGMTPTVTSGKSDDGGVVSNNQIARQGQLEATAERVAGHGRDGGHREVRARRRTRPGSALVDASDRRRRRRCARDSHRHRTPARCSSSGRRSEARHHASSRAVAASSIAMAVDRAFRASGRSSTISATPSPGPARRTSTLVTCPSSRMAPQCERARRAARPR